MASDLQLRRVLGGDPVRTEESRGREDRSKGDELYSGMEGK